MFGILPQRNLNQPQKKQTPQKNTDNPVEAIKDLGTDIVQKTAKDFVGDVTSGVIKGLFGKTGTLEPNQTIELSQLETPRPATVETYFKPFENPLEKRATILSARAEMAIANEINQVRAELQMLIRAARDLSKEADKAVSERPVNPGIYHLNFFERLKLILKVARQQIEESKTWLSCMQSKKAQKGYWAMFKKHGTSFAMSSERSLASSMG